MPVQTVSNCRADSGDKRIVRGNFPGGINYAGHKITVKNTSGANWVPGVYTISYASLNAGTPANSFVVLATNPAPGATAGVELTGGELEFDNTLWATLATICSQPVTTGANVTITGPTLANGQGTVNYQWYLYNGLTNHPPVTIAGATSQNLNYDVPAQYHGKQIGFACDIWDSNPGDVNRFNKVGYNILSSPISQYYEAYQVNLAGSAANGLFCTAWVPQVPMLTVADTQAAAAGIDPAKKFWVIYAGDSMTAGTYFDTRYEDGITAALGTMFRGVGRYAAIGTIWSQWIKGTTHYNATMALVDTFIASPLRQAGDVLVIDVCLGTNGGLYPTPAPEEARINQWVTDMNADLQAKGLSSSQYMIVLTAPWCKTSGVSININQSSDVSVSGSYNKFYSQIATPANRTYKGMSNGGRHHLPYPLLSDGVHPISGNAASIPLRDEMSRARIIGTMQAIAAAYPTPPAPRSLHRSVIRYSRISRSSISGGNNHR